MLGMAMSTNSAMNSITLRTFPPKTPAQNGLLRNQRLSVNFDVAKTAPWCFGSTNSFASGTLLDHFTAAFITIVGSP